MQKINDDGNINSLKEKLEKIKAGYKKPEDETYASFEAIEAAHGILTKEEGQAMQAEFDRSRKEDWN